MHALNAVLGAIRTLKKRMLNPEEVSQFNCGDCERWERCGLPPDEPCIIKSEQLERLERVGRHGGLRTLAKQQGLPNWL